MQWRLLTCLSWSSTEDMFPVAARFFSIPLCVLTVVVVLLSAWDLPLYATLRCVVLITEVQKMKNGQGDPTGKMQGSNLKRLQTLSPWDCTGGA